jgi:hypothetical protein
MLMKFRHLTVAHACIAFIASAALGQSNILDLEDLDKTMVTFERAFETKNADAIRLISDGKAQRLHYFETLLEHVSCCKVLSAYSSRRARQEFDVDGEKLVVDFTFRDEKWFVESASLNGRSLAPRGFSALASEYHFNVFIEAAAAGTITQYAGVRLDRNVTMKKLLPRSDTTVTLLNLLLHDGQAPRELFYVRLRKHPEVTDQRRGWLIEDVGSMLSYARQQKANDPLLEFLTNRTAFFDLRRPSTFSFINAREPEPRITTRTTRPTGQKVDAPADDLNLRAAGDASYALTRAATQDFKWTKTGLTSFALVFDIDGEIGAREWTAHVEGESLRIRATPPLRVVRVPSHPYLEIRSDDDDSIVVRMTAADGAPVRTLLDAQAGAPKVTKRAGVTRLTVPIRLPAGERRPKARPEGSR